MARTSARSRPPAPRTAGAAVATVDVSVVIVTYNVREFLEQAIESVARASGGLSVETFVVDNDSADGTAAAIRERFPDVRLIANEANVGFATANNQAIREARGRYVLVLNPDTLVQEDTLRALVAFMDAHPGRRAPSARASSTRTAPSRPSRGAPSPPRLSRSTASRASGGSSRTARASAATTSRTSRPTTPARSTRCRGAVHDGPARRRAGRRGRD